ncbi:MAG: hypothetical protein ABIQ88_12230 [Chitinophagaceae bacterium]
MNLRQPYEQLIADKLRQLPLPDADAAWQQMKRLLDDDEDRGAGGRKRPPGNGGRWWQIGIIAIVLSASFWLYEKNKTPEQAFSKNNPAASSLAADKTIETNNSNPSANNQKVIIDKTTTLPGSVINTIRANDAVTSNAKTVNEIPARKNITSTIAVKTAFSTQAGKNDNDSSVNNTIVKTNVSSNNKPVSISDKGGKNNAALNKDVAGIPNSLTAFSNNEKTHSRHSKENNSRLPDHHLRSIAQADNTGNSLQPVSTRQANETGKNIAAETNIGTAHNNGADYIAGKRTRKTDQPASGKINSYAAGGDDLSFTAGGDKGKGGGAEVAAQKKTWAEKLAALKTTDPVPAINTSLITGNNTADSLDATDILNNDTKKLVVKAKRDKEIEDVTRKEKKSFHLNLSNVFKPFSLHLDAEPRWAAGIGINNGITLNAQNRFNYNMNAKSGTLSDYIPSLYLQFHLNEYVYMQTELNFISPQYIPQLLLYQNSSDIGVQGAGMSQQKSIYIKKLYYFNLPVSLHYSPVNNFYFSAGLQFSSFQSGLAAIEQKQYQTALGPDHASNTSTSILKFKDDSIAAQIAPNEWRWQVGADYYWNRFSVGLRYNQSFKNAINTVVLPASPATKFRNESFLFFVRYNLFESRKKGNGEQKN